MTDLLIIGGTIAGLVVLAFLMGKLKTKEGTAKKSAKVSKEQVKAALERPKNKADLIRRLRKGKL